MMFHLAHAAASILDQRVLFTDLHRKPLSDDELEQRDNVIQPTVLNQLDWMDLYLPYNQEHKFVFENIQRFRENYRLILMEAPAAEGNPTPDPIVLSALFDHVLLVFRHRDTPLEKVQQLVEVLQEQKVHSVSVLLNQSIDEPKQTAIWKHLLALAWGFIKRLFRVGQQQIQKAKTKAKTTNQTRKQKPPEVIGMIKAPNTSDIETPKT